MLQEVLNDDDFFKVSSGRRLVNISGTVRNREVKVSRNNCINKPVIMEGSTAALTLLWWQKLELNEYLRKQASNLFKILAGWKI
jgi:hypothetical protein